MPRIDYNNYENSKNKRNGEYKKVSNVSQIETNDIRFYYKEYEILFDCIETRNEVGDFGVDIYMSSTKDSLVMIKVGFIPIEAFESDVFFEMDFLGGICESYAPFFDKNRDAFREMYDDYRNYLKAKNKEQDKNNEET